MLNIIFAICMLLVFRKLLIFGIKAAWGISRIVVTVIFFPVIMIGIIIGGLAYIALPVVIVLGVALMIMSKTV